VKQWWRRQETHFDWMVAWMGGSATVAFLLHHAAVGWTYAAVGGLFAAGGITAHMIRPPEPPPLTTPAGREL
jgi:hypothetical protein